VAGHSKAKHKWLSEMEIGTYAEAEAYVARDCWLIRLRLGGSRPFALVGEGHPADAGPFRAGGSEGWGPQPSIEEG
jgi:hypothetical protein